MKNFALEFMLITLEYGNAATFSLDWTEFPEQGHFMEFLSEGKCRWEAVWHTEVGAIILKIADGHQKLNFYGRAAFEIYTKESK